jgi:hypothetical protein
MKGIEQSKKSSSFSTIEGRGDSTTRTYRREEPCDNKEKPEKPQRNQIRQKPRNTVTRMADSNVAGAWNAAVGTRIGATALEEDLYDPGLQIDVNPVRRNLIYAYLWTSDIAHQPVTAGTK